MSTAIANFTNNQEALHLLTKAQLNLSDAVMGEEYLIKDIITRDEEIKEFLYTLGCFKGQEITVISILANNLVISVKDARYSIDSELAEVIKI